MSDQIAYICSPHQLFPKGFFKRGEGPNCSSLVKQIVADKAAELFDASKPSEDAKMSEEGSASQGVLRNKKQG